MTRLSVGSLFAGIGGFDLGFARAGFDISWQVEIDPFCRAVLERHWPEVRRYEDVRRVHAYGGFDAGPCADCLSAVDVLVGGFPCQDVSYAGGGAGLDGIRSGLWGEMRRLVRELRPRYVVVENVAGLLPRGLGRVLGDLAGIGYDAEWSCVSACAVGAPHVRRRVFLVAYPDGEHGRARLWHSDAPTVRALQAFDGFARARTGWQARLADPSTLYGGADGVPDGLDRNHAIGNAIVPAIAEWIAQRLLAAEGVTR
jgi:DNA (cytosine-5)-methyltransferase 1